MTTPKLALPELSVAQSSKELTHNQALAMLDQLVQMVVIDKDLSAPPISPANGAAYIVAASATGAWAGKEGQIAYWLTSVAAWTFVAPLTGWEVRVADELDAYGAPKLYVKSSAGWVIPDAGTASAAPSETVTESTTARNLGLTDAGKYIRHTNAGASTVTVPPQASVAWVADTEIHIRRAGANDLTLTPGAGVTLNAPSGGTLVMTEAMTVTIKRVASDVWDVIGQTVAL